jgi:oligopeptide/dipeptide ABC transporter ATP-binding protein
MSLLEVRDLRREFRAPGAGWRGASLAAVDGVSLSLDPGECLAVVGESGSGKTTLARCIARLIEPTSGTVRFRGADFLALRGRRLREQRRFLQPVFQDPSGALNPALRIGDALLEPMRSHRLVERREGRAKVSELLRRVGLPADSAGRFPHEFSGGQRQRIGIARALATDPQLLIADEPVSALDASVRAQILALLRELREQQGLALLFVAHDLSAVATLAGRLLVLYAGRAVEEGPAAEVLERPRHPYTQLLKQSAPSLSPASSTTATRRALPDVGPFVAGSGCAFAGRCARRQADCAALQPSLRPIDDQRRVACHHPLDPLDPLDPLGGS